MKWLRKSFDGRSQEKRFRGCPVASKEQEAAGIAAASWVQGKPKEGPQRQGCAAPVLSQVEPWPARITLPIHFVQEADRRAASIKEYRHFILLMREHLAQLEQEVASNGPWGPVGRPGTARLPRLGAAETPSKNPTAIISSKDFPTLSVLCRPSPCRQISPSLVVERCVCPPFRDTDNIRRNVVGLSVVG